MMERITANWPVKLLAVIAAIIMWLFVLGTEDPQTTQAISVPVVPVNEPEELQIIDVTPSSVELRIRGRQRAIEQAQLGNLRMEANLRNATVGSNEVPLRVAGVPLGVTVIPGYQSSAQVELDSIIHRQRPVDHERRGEPAAGFIVEQISVEPAEVTVRGATSIVRDVTRAVVIVDTSGLNSSVSFSAPLEARDQRDQTVAGVTLDPPEATVEVEVSQMSVRTVPVRPVVGDPPSGYQVTEVSVTPTVVTIAGDEGLDAVTSVSTALVDISGLRGTRAHAVPLNVPSGLAVLGSASVSVSVTTRPVPSPPTAPDPPPEPDPDAVDDPRQEPAPPAENQENGPALEDAPERDDPEDAPEGGTTEPGQP